MPSPTELEAQTPWHEAAQKLERLIRRYSTAENVEMRTLYHVILPLKEQFDQGERSEKLYEEIMDLEE